MCQVEIEEMGLVCTYINQILEMTVLKLVINKLKEWDIKTVIMTQTKEKLRIQITN